MTAIVDMTKEPPFGRLTVLSFAGLDKHRKARWKCRCTCGNEVTVNGNALRRGNTKSCGCLNEEKNYYPPRKCIYCRHQYQPRAKYQTVCGSPECLQRFHREWKRRHYKSKAPPPRDCEICGRQFQPIRQNNIVCQDPECRAERKRRLANARNRGELRPGDTEIFCLICGDPVMAHPNTVTCAKRECILERRRQTSRKTKGLKPCRCIVCSTRFWPSDRGPGQHYTCSEKCSRIARMRRNRRTYANNREERLARLAERKRTDPAFRGRLRQLDTESRRRKATAKAVREISETTKHLEERLNAD